MSTLSQNHWTSLLFRQRMTTAQWRKVLLEEQDCIAFKGNPCHLKAKSLGAGVVEVYKDIAETREGGR